MHIHFHASKHSHTHASKLLVCGLVSACYDMKNSILKYKNDLDRPDKLDISTAMHLDAVKRKIPALLSWDTFYGKREGQCKSCFAVVSLTHCFLDVTGQILLLKCKQLS